MLQVGAKMPQDTAKMPPRRNRKAPSRSDESNHSTKQPNNPTTRPKERRDEEPAGRKAPRPRSLAECAKRLNPPPAPSVGRSRACQIHSLSLLHPQILQSQILQSLLDICKLYDGGSMTPPFSSPGIRAFRQASQKIQAPAFFWRSKFNQNLDTSWEPS